MSTCRIAPLRKTQPKLQIPNKIHFEVDRSRCLSPALVWILSFGVSASLCAWQILICTQKYFSEPVGTDVVIETFSSYKSPAITICPATFNFTFDFDPIFQKKCSGDKICSALSETQKMMYEFDKLDTSLRDLWNVWSAEPDFSVGVLCKYAVNESECDENKWLSKIDVDTVAGKCRIFYTDLYWHFTGKTWVWWLFISNPHSNSTLPHLQSITYMLDLHVAKLIKKEFIARLYIDDNLTNEVEVSVTEFKYLNTTRNPCITDEEEIHCLNNCTNTYFLRSKTDCKLPFIDSQLPDCNSMSRVDKVQKTIFKLHFSNKECGCKRSCNTSKFSLTRVIGRYRIGDGTGIAVTFTSNTKQVVSEFFLYPFSSLVSELGGNVGLFLGISLLSILTRLDLFVQRIYKYFHKFKQNV